MKRFFISLAVCSLLASAVSCEYDAPNINFTTTVTNDYSEVVQAIEDQTLTLAEKLKIINDALDNQTLTITQQAGILKKAYENGVMTDLGKSKRAPKRNSTPSRGRSKQETIP